MGAPPSEDDYSSMIILSLPESYQVLLTTLGDAAQQAGKPLNSDNYITKAIQEYERRHIRDEKSATKDAAFSASNRNGKNNGNGSGSLKRYVECHNCHRRGHYKTDCWAKGGGKAGQGPRSKRYLKGKGKSQAANMAANIEDGCWLATTKDFINDLSQDGSLEELDDDSDMILNQISSSSDEDDDTTDYSEESGFASIWDSEGYDSDEISRPLSLTSDNSAEYTSIDIGAVALTKSVCPGCILELYDSGATRHMTPYRHLLSNYVSITLKPINTANKHTFQAVGCGDLKINVPMDKRKATIMLKNVLFAPEIGMTLISIGLVDRAGYTATFGNGACTICDKNKRIIRRIPSKDGLYCVMWDNLEMVHTAKEVLTIMQLHARMGHIAPDIAKSLVKNGLITGIELDDSSCIETCDSCTYGKLT
jgi:Pol polyprotein, beta-barrel domain/GAG-pre-integrase domain